MEWHPSGWSVCLLLLSSLATKTPEDFPLHQLTRIVPKTHTRDLLQPFFRDHPGEPVPEENFWTLWCKRRLTEADAPTIWLGATPSGLTSARLHHFTAQKKGRKMLCVCVCVWCKLSTAGRINASMAKVFTDIFIY